VVAVSFYQNRLATMQKTLSRLHQAGVPIVLGSDTANWAVLTGFPHGMTTLREAQLLEQAGLTPMEVIVAGTSRAAELLQVSQDRGTLAIGMRADMVILADDPLEGMQAVWSVLWTVKDGIAKTPQEWMTPDSTPATSP
jgi:imidazolonepropionase-like amidohydrolase